MDHSTPPPPPPLRTPPATPGGHDRRSSSPSPESPPQKRTPTSIRRKPVPGSPDRARARADSYPLPGGDGSGEPPYSPPPPPPHAVMQGMAQSQYQQHLPHFSGHYSTRVTSLQSNDSRDLQTPFPDMMLRYDDPNFVEPLPSPSFKPQHIHQGVPMPLPHSAVISSGESRSSKGSINFDPEAAGRNGSPLSGASSGEETTQQSQYFPQQPQRSQKSYPQLSNHHHQGPQQYQQETPNGSSNSLPPNGSSNSLTPSGPGTPNTGRSSTPPSDGQQPAGRHLAPNTAIRSVSRPMSAYSMGPDARNKSPQGNSPNTRAVSSGNYDNRRSSYLDLTQPAHVQQQHRPVSNMDNAHLQRQVGAFASLLSSKQTLEMYRANAKKTQDPMLQYELAVFMVQLAQQSPEGAVNPGTPLGSPDKELLREARATLERICSRLPQAQYYLADAYSSGLFNKGTKEDEKAFPLFVAASKHGHAEAGYRAALCYEFGWGCRKDPLKAVQFFRHAASKSHPGAMTRLGIACLRSDLGLQGRYREGLKWLKRATEIADIQYPSAPYELGLLHETGYGDSVLPDPSYSAQLFTQAAELGHADASFRMGDAYEHGKLNCPRDPALSVHFYTGAAQRGHATAMMALCAWYLVGAEPVLEKNEREAYAWAAKAAEQELPKAEYATGYFTEMGIGCRRDPLEANVWYVRAAGHGDERAVARLKIINEAAASGGSGTGGGSAEKAAAKKAKKTLEKKQAGANGVAEKGDCCVM